MPSEIESYQKKFIRYCTLQRKLSSASVKAYEVDLRQFVEFLNKQSTPIIMLSQIDKHILEDYLNCISEKFQVKSVKRKFACLRSLFTFLEYEEAIVENPFLKFHLRMKEPKKLPNSLTMKEVEGILKAAYTRVGRNKFEDRVILRDAAILELLFASGMRVGELCNLQFEDYDPLNQVLLVHGKGSRERFVYLTSDFVLAALKSYLEKRKDWSPDIPYLFVTRQKTPISTQDVRSIVTKYTEMAGIKKNVTPHSFRHSFASLLLEEGVDIKYIQEFLGHSSISTTQIYLHTTDAKKKQLLQDFHPRNKLSTK